MDAYKLSHPGLNNILAISAVFDEKIPQPVSDTKVYPPYDGWEFQFVEKMASVQNPYSRNITFLIGHNGSEGNITFVAHRAQEFPTKWFIITSVKAVNDIAMELSHAIDAGWIEPEVLVIDCGRIMM